ncbi:hypothetical protein D3C81_2046570 [compost metagenome]
MAFHCEQSRDGTNGYLNAIGAAVRHVPGNRHHLVKTKGQIGTVSALHCEVSDKWWYVLYQFCVFRPQEVDDHINRRPVVVRFDLPH